MKKTLSLILSLILLLSSCAFYVSGYETNTTVNAKDIIEGGQGIGFYDNEENSEATMPESAGDTQITLRADEWVKYDLSELDLAEGTYEVSIKIKATAWARQHVFVDLFIDDMLALKGDISANVNTYSDMVLGEVFLNRDCKTFKILNSAIYNDYYLSLESITFTLVNIQDTVTDNYELKIHAFNIASSEKASSADGYGSYWDAAGFTLPHGNIIDGSSYIHNAGDWSKYSIKGIRPGTYSIYLEAASRLNSNMTMLLDSKVIFMDRTFESSGSDYNTPREDFAGRVYLDGTEESIKISTTSNAVYLKGVRLSLESEDNLLLDTSLRVEAEIPIPGGQNEAYFDNGTVATRLDVLEINAGATGSTICHRTGEWVKYAIRNLKPGRYALDISSASIVEVALSVELDGEIQIKESLLPVQASYSDYQTNRLGYLEIETSDEIIMKVSHVNSAVATYIDYFELTKVEPFETEGLKTNVNDDGKVSRGADTLKIAVNNVVNAETVKNAKVKNNSGQALNSIVSVGKDNKEIVISLFETLDYDSDYEIDLSEVTDAFEQYLDDAYIYFTTENEGTDDGFASLSDIITIKEDIKTTYKGTVLTSQGYGIKGRKVTLDAFMPNGEKTEQKTIITDESGNFEFVVLYDTESESGAYTYKINTDYLENAKLLTDTFYTESVNEELCEDINFQPDALSAKEALIRNEKKLGIDALGTDSGINMQYVYENFVERNFENASDINKEFNQCIVLEKINQATSVSEVEKIINNKEEGLLLSINYDSYDKLSDEARDNVIKTIFEEDRISLISDMAEFIKDTIANEIKNEYNLSTAEIEAEFPTVTEGSGGTVKIRFKEKCENVTGIYIVLSFDEGTVFENEPVEVDTGIKHAEVKLSREGSRIFIDIEREYTLDDIKEICDITFTTLSGQNGEYNLTISGFAVFLLSDGSAEIDFPSDINGVFEVTKAKTSSKGDYSPSNGGNGGGTSSFGTISLPEKKEEKPAEPTGEPVSLEVFSDLSDASWAKDSIVTLYEMGVVSGRGDGTFAPNEAVSRAEFLKILLGVLKIEEGGISQFKDVKENDWFYPYVSKAAELSIVTGDENGNFAPNDKITRQDMAVISYRLLLKNSSVSPADSYFDDSHLISDYAKEAVGSLFNAGMISGMGDNLFAPKTYVTRAMAAQFAYNMLYPKEVTLPQTTEKEDVGKRAMIAEIREDKLSVRTSFDDENDLIQEFSGFKADNIDSNGVINYSVSSLVSKNDEEMFKSGLVLSQGTDEAAPFNINNAYIGANHGQPSGVLIKCQHNKTYSDIGSVWKDDADTKWNLLKIVSKDELLFISDNYGISETEYSFVRDVKGNLEYVSDGINKENITVISYLSGQQIVSAVKIVDKQVYAVVDGVGYILTDGTVADCDYVDIVEKYEIINPSTIADSLRKNRPSDGYKENVCLATGSPMVKYNMIYRITPDGTVLSMFDHEIVQEINLNYYLGVMAQERNDAFKGGVYRYIPKTDKFIVGGTEYDFTNPTEVSKGDVPDITLSSVYWENENMAPDREVSYMRDNDGNDAVAFADGFIPIYDAAPDVRNEKVNAWGFLYPTKKHYPFYVTAKAFEKTGTKGQNIKGVGYKKYENMTNDLSALGTAYTIPYENDMYIFIDYHKTGTDEIAIPQKLLNKTLELVEKTENIFYTTDGSTLTVSVNGDNYGFIVLKVCDGGYGTNTYSKTIYSDKYITQ